MQEQDPSASPVNPLPPVVLALAGTIMALELAFQAGARGFVGGPLAVAWRSEAWQAFAFHAREFAFSMESGQWSLGAIWRLFTYAFLHVSLTHALFAAVLLLALGNYTAKVYAAWVQVVVFVTASIAGAVTFGLTTGGQGVLIGAYPGVYGFLGLLTWALWVQAEELGVNPYTAFRLVGILVAIQIVFILIDGRWDSLFAEVAGFAAGFALAIVLAPGGIARLKARMRDR